MFTKTAAILAVIGSAAAITVSTPSETISQCAELTFNVGESNGPFYFAVVNSDAPCDSDAVYETTTPTEGNTYTWKVTAPVGSVISAIVDNGDDTAEGWSGAMTVVAGDDSCLTDSGAEEEEEVEVEDVKENPVTNKPITNDDDDDTPINAVDGDVNAPSSAAQVMSSTFAAIVMAGLVAWAY